MPQLQDSNGVKSIRPTWFEDETAAKTTAEPMHGPRLIIKEDVPPLSNHPRFEALEEVAKRGLLAPETWHCNRPHVSLKTTVDVPLLGTVIEQNGDGCLEDSLMPVGRPLHLTELSNKDASTVPQHWANPTIFSKPTIWSEILSSWTTRLPSGSTRQSGISGTWKSREGIRWSNCGTITKPKSQRKRPTPMRSRRMISTEQRVLQRKPSARLPDSMFLRTLGTEDVYTAPPQTGALSLRAAEEWERCICENKVHPAPASSQEGRPELIKKDGGEMPVSIVLDRPLDDAKALVEDPDRLISEITAILESNQSHPLLDQMVNPDVRDRFQ